jgi:hypothetical protein
MAKQVRERDRYPRASPLELLGNELRNLRGHPGLIAIIVLVAGGWLVLQVTQPKVARVDQLTAGECIYIPIPSSGGLEVTTGSEGTFLGMLYQSGTELAPCDASHSHEVLATWTYEDAPGAAFPGPTALEAGRREGCDDAFATYVGVPEASSVYTYALGTPDQASWDKGTRTGICLLYRRDQSLLTGPARGSGR